MSGFITQALRPVVYARDKANEGLSRFSRRLARGLTAVVMDSPRISAENKAFFLVIALGGAAIGFAVFLDGAVQHFQESHWVVAGIELVAFAIPFVLLLAGLGEMVYERMLPNMNRKGEE